MLSAPPTGFGDALVTWTVTSVAPPGAVVPDDGVAMHQGSVVLATQVSEASPRLRTRNFAGWACEARASLRSTCSALTRELDRLKESDPGMVAARMLVPGSGGRTSMSVRWARN